MTVTETLITWGPLVVLVLGWLWAGGRLAAKSEQFDAIMEKLEAVEIKLERFSVLLIGIDGTNGLRGEVKQLRADMEELQSAA